MRLWDFTFYIAQVIFEGDYGWGHDAIVRNEGMIYIDWFVVKIWLSLCTDDEHGYSLMYDCGLWWDLKLICVTKVILNGYLV